MPSAKLSTKLKLNNAIFSFEAIGTKWEIEIFDFPDPQIIYDKIKRRIEIFDKNYSRFRGDSLVTKISKKSGKYRLPPDGKKLFDLYGDLYKISDGLVTPLVGQTLADAGYDADYSFVTKNVHPAPKWDDVMHYSYPWLEVKKPVLLDLGALGKGYLIDIVGKMLKNAGCKNFIVNAGGDILHFGPNAVPIALEHPVNFSQAIGVAHINNEAICGSAGNKRSWGNYTHIINPQSLTSPKHVLAVWAVAKSAILADAMTTALYFVKPEQLTEHYDFSYVILSPNFSLYYSPKFPAKFFN